jgi:hypothetical protein
LYDVKIPPPSLLVCPKYYKKSFKIRKYLFPLDRTEKTASSNRMALIHWKQKRLNETLDFHSNVSQIFLLPKHDDIAVLLMPVGNILIDQDKFDEAFDYHINYI